ncbi:hypothetical protein MNEG_16533 [Monoraphidium neglectum]|uniref:Uncharacterized protein n=1 Tax=Monoraphidium neglectum TaxID=145388 RepID=A0A0D2LN04_9CHLO|nr:hypothetical protein MNEG_16533 [Monoraphidium neglectum]KIY91431.1 hypothetical protein MNEG_16533 [Monoraphidium neglectum]|eukprot:XP_013890451.1 hypothetical protein MNEG_16533 [Monoraphidium neglectum]
MEGRKQAEKLKWGVKLRLDLKKPVIGLAAHPREQQLVALFGDGALRGYALGQGGLVPTFTLPVDSLAGRVSLAACLLEGHKHPFIPGAALLLYGTQNGGIMAFELAGRDEPRLLLRARAPGGRAVVGMGVHRDSNTLLAFTLLPDGEVGALGWQMYSMSASGTPAGAAAGPTGADATAAAAGASREGRIVLAAVPVEMPTLAAAPDGGAAAAPATSRPPQAGAAGGAAGGGSAASWQDLWAPMAAAVADDGSKNFLLGRVLAPSVSSVAVHPTLGIVAVQQLPPLALRQ